MFEYKNKINNKKRGFTLIELLVVISIIGMLSSIVLSSLQDARAKARDARRLSDIRQIQNALELYRDEKGKYPTTSWAMSNSNNIGFRNAWNTTLRNELVVNNKFLPELPTDPKPENTTFDYVHLDNNVYGYTYYSHPSATFLGCPIGQYYLLEFRLEANKKINLGPGFIRCDNGSIYKYGPGTAGLYTTGMGK